MTGALAVAGGLALAYGITGNTSPRTLFVIVAILLLVTAAARWEAGREDELERRREWDRRYNR